MKKGFLFGFVLLLLLPVSVFAGNDSPWETKLPFKNATIRYTISGMEN